MVFLFLTPFPVDLPWTETNKVLSSILACHAKSITYRAQHRASKLKPQECLPIYLILNFILITNFAISRKQNRHMAVYAFTCCHFRVFLNIRPLVTNPNTHYGSILVSCSPRNQERILTLVSLWRKYSPQSIRIIINPPLLYKMNHSYP